MGEGCGHVRAHEGIMVIEEIVGAESITARDSLSLPIHFGIGFRSSACG